ncbi:MAG: DUF3383 family protein, partial [Bilophila wadsworthia]
MKALSAAVPANSAAYWAGNAFFSRDDRPKTLAVGAFTEPTAAELTGGQVALSGLANVTDGAFDIEVNDTLVPVSGLSFDGTPTIAEVAEVLNTALASRGVTVAASGNALRLVTTQAGDGASLGSRRGAVFRHGRFRAAQAYVRRAASNIPGYTPGDLVSEIGLIQTAARCSGNAVYGWAIDAQYRDTDEQKAVADWAEGQSPAIFGACTNAPNAYDTANTTNIGYYAMNSGYRRTFTFYHDNPQVYPEMSYLALALSVNYALNNSTLTMKFKQLPGIS